ncbi:MAG: quinolinate synthase NadA [Pirellulales bacterium]|nr:quinolinate synthase NadA [Pirellulales bacterium]
MNTVEKAVFDFSDYESLEAAVASERVQRARGEMGRRLLVLGHHYQRDEVIELADLRGDSYKLSELAAENRECRAIVFCGVHFMAETADILANRPERLAERGGARVPVILPDLRAGCSLADMADGAQVERCWHELADVIDTEDVTPITYVNSSAELKAFCGRHGGIVCTSANARGALEWAFSQRERVLFFPDQHLGRNTARAMDIPLKQMPLWDPGLDGFGGNPAEAIRGSRVILWKGYCGVHQFFLPGDIDRLREKYPDIKVIVHPECMMEVADRADALGSTGRIISEIEQSPPGTRWAVGTERRLVERLRREHPDKEIHLLSDEPCICETMSMIDLPHLCWAVENLAAGAAVNVVEVEPQTARWALEALKRMLEVK